MNLINISSIEFARAYNGWNSPEKKSGGDELHDSNILPRFNKVEKNRNAFFFRCNDWLGHP
jgi:hypothetical protein